ncbi:MAG: chondroitinase family polysaccharide lyase [Bacteroidales bacterium]
MKRRRIKLLATLICFLFSTSILFSQTIDFETSVLPARVVSPGSGFVSQSDIRWKDGAKSILWEWTGENTQLLIDQRIPFDLGDFRQGTVFWIYNEKPVADFICCRFIDDRQVTQYQFNFNLNFSGWRIARVGSIAMSGPKLVRTGLRMMIDAPASERQGRLYLDRMSFRTDVDYRTANDAQIPVAMRTDWLTHWSKLYTWSLFKTTDSRPGELSAEQLQALAGIRSNLDAIFVKNNNQIASAGRLFEQVGIRETAGVLTGRPFVTYDDRNKATGTDMSFEEYGNLLSGLAQDYLFNGNEEARRRFLLTFRFGLDQGFAAGSSMGNNSHYGYYTRTIFPALFAMRHVLKENGLLESATEAAIYWSGLYECHQPFDFTRGGVVDCWNTILPGRIYAAAMHEDATDAYSELQRLASWTGKSLNPTSGTAGGLKWDGTVFHHAGHYPAYAVGGFGGLGLFFQVFRDSGILIPVLARRTLRSALLAMATYTNRTDWTLGFSGRHPHAGGITQGALNAMAHLALYGGIDDESEKIDTLLGNQYLRLQDKDNNLCRELLAGGCVAAKDPEGFFVYNHHAAGVYRTGDKMVTVKGYNEQVWSSEIYAANNRYGRYQGYGALELLTAGTPISRLGSGFSEPGWDWNCLPGTTTVHLPNSLLDSPVAGSLLVKSAEKFAGASSLGNTGIFGMKLAEASGTNFTPSHKARKSVFFFGDRIVCLGSDITNTNKIYPTTTTLFQNRIASPVTQQFDLEGEYKKAMGTELNQTLASPFWISDLAGNYYCVAAGQKIIVSGKTQYSNHNQNKTATTGDFLLARLDHGTAPMRGSYEYMILLTPEKGRLDQLKQNSDYSVLQQNTTAHIVRDNESGITGYVVFDYWQNAADRYINRISSESMVLLKTVAPGKLQMSVCAPDLNFGETKTGSNEIFKPSRELPKTVVVNGRWEIAEEDQTEEVVCSSSASETVITVSCSFGLPVAFTLISKDPTSVGSTGDNPRPQVFFDNRYLHIEGYTEEVWVTMPDGKLLYHGRSPQESHAIGLPAIDGLVMVIIRNGNRREVIAVRADK